MQIILPLSTILFHVNYVLGNDRQWNPEHTFRLYIHWMDVPKFQRIRQISSRLLKVCVLQQMLINFSPEFQQRCK